MANISVKDGDWSPVIHEWLFEFLDELNIQITPGEGQGHTISLSTGGELIVTLFTGMTYRSVLLQRDDFKEKPRDLVTEIKEFIK